MHDFNFLTSGVSLQQAEKALIMVHGRGGRADDILSLAGSLNVSGYSLIAPQASNNSWYPYSFLVPTSKNEPWLSSALNVLEQTVKHLNEHGISENQIYFLGFSQGACLLLEFAARNARRWGGLVGFTGGLIGDKIDLEKYRGDFKQTPVFLGTSSPDIHVPIERVKETEAIYKSLHARVDLKVYLDMGHTINKDEIEIVNNTILNQ
jgi:phospholipase/carboxylesterase